MLEDKQTVRAVDRALQILKSFTFEKRQMSLTEICKLSELPKTTVFRLLTALEEQGFIQKDSITQNYKLGALLFRLGSIVLSDLDIKKVSLPILEELAAKTKETLNINIVQDDERVCLVKVEGSHDLRQFIEIGKGLPLHKGASGKVLLAYLPEDRQEQILNSINEDMGKSRKEFMAELNEIRKNGYAVSRDERVLGAAAVSAPIFDCMGNLAGGLTISGATIRFTEERVRELIILGTEASNRISSALGYEGGGR